MHFIWETLSVPELIISSSIIFIILLAFYLLIIGTSHRLLTYVILILGTVLFLVGFICNLDVPLFSGGIIIVIMEVTALSINGKNFLKYFSDDHKIKAEEHTKFDEANYAILTEVISKFSKNHVGALITIERQDDLTEYYEKNGSKVDAPLSAELLETIFYTGTRLHDGAVIIQKNRIMAASVFFMLTTKRFQTKLGSRHRAALGISETTDSLSIVVSEETGQISFAMNGCLETVARENIDKMLHLFMESDQGGIDGRTK